MLGSHGDSACWVAMVIVHAGQPVAGCYALKYKSCKNRKKDSDAMAHACCLIAAEFNIAILKTVQCCSMKSSRGTQVCALHHFAAQCSQVWGCAMPGAYLSDSTGFHWAALYSVL